MRIKILKQWPGGHSYDLALALPDHTTDTDVGLFPMSWIRSVQYYGVAFRDGLGANFNAFRIKSDGLLIITNSSIGRLIGTPFFLGDDFANATTARVRNAAKLYVNPNANGRQDHLREKLIQKYIKEQVCALSL